MPTCKQRRIPTQMLVYRRGHIMADCQTVQTCHIEICTGEHSRYLQFECQPNTHVANVHVHTQCFQQNMHSPSTIYFLLACVYILIPTCNYRTDHRAQTCVKKKAFSLHAQAVCTQCAVTTLQIYEPTVIANATPPYHAPCNSQFKKPSHA